MASEIIRSENGKGTIPNYSTLSGTFSTDGVVSDIIRYTGPLTAQDVFGPDLQRSFKNNLYVYESASANGSLRLITGVLTSDKTSTTWAVLVESSFNSALVTHSAKIVEANLNEYGVLNDGGSDGFLGGVSFKSGDSVDISEDSRRRKATRNREAKAFNATGTTFLITELK